MRAAPAVSVLGPSGHKNEYHCATLDNNWQEERHTFGKQPGKSSRFEGETTYKTSYLQLSPAQVASAKPPSCFSDEAPSELLFLHGDGPFESHLTVSEVSYTDKVKPPRRKVVAIETNESSQDTRRGAGKRPETVVFSLDETLDMQGTSNRCERSNEKRHQNGLPSVSKAGNVSYCGEKGVWNSTFRSTSQRQQEYAESAADGTQSGRDAALASVRGRVPLYATAVTQRMIARRIAAQQNEQDPNTTTTTTTTSNTNATSTRSSDAVNPLSDTADAAMRSGFYTTIPAVGQLNERERFLTTKHTTTDATGEFLFDNPQEYPAVSTRSFGKCVMSFDNTMHRTDLRTEWEYLD